VARCDYCFLHGYGDADDNKASRIDTVYGLVR